MSYSSPDCDEMVVRRASILLLTLVVDVFSLLPRGNTLPRHAARSGRQTAQMLARRPRPSTFPSPVGAPLLP